MQERIIDIIVYLLEGLKYKPKKENYSDLSRELLSRGYTENEINLAFSWIFNHLQKDDTDESAEFTYSEGSIRILHDLERLVIAPEGYGYLLQLWQLGLLKEVEMEEVIEKALSIGTANITLEDVKSIVAGMFFNLESTPSFEGFFYHQGTNTIH